MPELYFVDGRWLGVQAVGSGRGGSPLGHPQEQTQNELREIVTWSPLLLRQKHHPQNGGQAIRLPIRLRSSKSVRVGIRFWIASNEIKMSNYAFPRFNRYTAEELHAMVDLKPDKKDDEWISNTFSPHLRLHTHKHQMLTSSNNAALWSFQPSLYSYVSFRLTNRQTKQEKKNHWKLFSWRLCEFSIMPKPIFLFLSLSLSLDFLSPELFLKFR